MVDDYWAVSVTHSDVAFDVKGGAAGETEGFHVGEHLRFVESCIAPRPSETAHQFLVDGTPDHMNRSPFSFSIINIS